ncbi:hypothetical protein C6P40_001645 [Pichia californica]|uniref:DNA helicase n=1 Tax=Pichia californica TaxID=460514 RepID=A0A9P6WQN3_9ASCO|nr:hypothetical protein C6P40_001645 [[Candida] californica]
MSGRKTRQNADEVIDLLSSSSDSEVAQGSSDFSDPPQPSIKKKSNISKKAKSKILNIKSDNDDDDDDESDDNIKTYNSVGDSRLRDQRNKQKDKQKSISETKKVSKKPSKKEIKFKHYDSDSFIEIGNESDSAQYQGNGHESDDSENEEGVSDDDEEDNDGYDDDDSRIQVPNSSPLKKKSKYSLELESSPPSKIRTKLPSLRDQFAFKIEKTNSDPANFKTDYLELKRQYPDLAASTIISALKSQKTLRNTMRYLKTISGSSPSTRKLSSSATTRRLDSLSRKSEKIILSSSPERGRRQSRLSVREERDARLKEKAKAIEKKKKLALEEKKKKLKREREIEKDLARKKAEAENVVSSKVVLNAEGTSIRDRFLSEYSRNAAAHSDEEGNDSGVEDLSDEGSDSSLEEVRAPSTRSRSGKKKYEDDDDYSPSSKREKTKTDRTNRAEKRSVVVEDDDFMLPEFELNKDSKMNKTARILKLFNNADIRDIIDLSLMKPEQASIIIKNRPYKNITEINQLDLRIDKKTHKLAKQPIERYIETITEKLSAYEAIDSLLKNCFEYSKSITGEIKKWGFNLKGKNLNGEISISTVDNIMDDESDDSDDSDDEVDVIDEPVKRKAPRKKFKVDGSENDDDFRVNGKKKIYKSRIDNSLVKDKVGYFSKKPKLMPAAIKLKDYQQVGINWIHMLFQKQLSCILADEMGLGKTAQVVAFLSHLKKKGYKGPHLIVVPSSTLENWLREFGKFSPTLKVIPYYGSVEEREELRYVLMEEDYDVVVTTYNLATGKIDSPFLHSMDFNVVVYDEGHMLKNAVSDRYKKLTKIKANFRLLLTGTPLQNNLKELISLLDFILPEIFDSKLEKLQLLFDQKATTKVENEKIEGEKYNPLMSEQAISKAKVMMSPFVLRRTKAQVMKDLPPKHTSIEYCELNPSQKEIYENELREIDEFRKEKARRNLLDEKELKKLSPLPNRSGNTLMILRKICMHPLLFRRHYTDAMLRIMSNKIMENPSYVDANKQFIFEDMQVMTDFELTQLCHTFPAELGRFVLKQSVYEDSGKVQLLVKLLTGIIERKEKVLIFSLFTQLLDILEKVLSVHNWKFLRLDGSTSVQTRQTMIDKFYEDKTIPIFLLSTKAGGFGINLVCATNVIIFDQSLNPHDDKQAEDRAHRVGQTKEVHVARLITKGSIEENILQLAFNKLQLDNSMMAQNVEDVLLKTVEDLLAKKDERKDKNEENKITELKSEEKKESVFQAFETPITMDMVEDAEKDLLDEPVEVSIDNDDESGKRKKRNRNNVNYFESGPNVIDKEFIISDDESETKHAKKQKVLKEKSQNTQNELKDESYEPNDEDISEISHTVNSSVPELKKNKDGIKLSVSHIPVLPSNQETQTHSSVVPRIRILTPEWLNQVMQSPPKPFSNHADMQVNEYFPNGSNKINHPGFVNIAPKREDNLHFSNPNSNGISTSINTNEISLEPKNVSQTIITSTGPHMKQEVIMPQITNIVNPEPMVVNEEKHQPDPVDDYL